MARKYHLGPARRAFNAVASRAIRLGIALPSGYILTTRGRKTGVARSTPLGIVRRDGYRWLVAPYGAVGWVHNARAAGRVTLSKGGRSEEVSVTEVGPDEAAPILRLYLRKFPVVRPFFNFGARSPEEKIVEQAPRHPVFRIDD